MRAKRGGGGGGGIGGGGWGGVWPVKRAAEIEGGDLVVGGLHMVHEREEGLTCGPVMPQGGLQGPNSIRRKRTGLGLDCSSSFELELESKVQNSLESIC